ncbi:RES domain-containing protein [Arachidicoccus soli]|uniref:RES domain-containing protein n=1 Tax=Arachidicoccus soli TaxID=2341117 RepID=A0A386HQC9_9BACT|nr:RES domain-containing protein [Arachidicoccus soli]
MGVVLFYLKKKQPYHQLIWQDDCAVLQVSSATITEEYNYLINPQHPAFTRIKVHRVENFTFDERLMQ